LDVHRRPAQLTKHTPRPTDKHTPCCWAARRASCVPSWARRTPAPRRRSARCARSWGRRGGRRRRSCRGSGSARRGPRARWVRRAFPSCTRSISTEIHLCHTCSYHEILRMDTPGQGTSRCGRTPPAPPCCVGRGAASQPRLVWSDARFCPKRERASERRLRTHARAHAPRVREPLAAESTRARARPLLRRRA
jgi:hypothetical protein